MWPAAFAQPLGGTFQHQSLTNGDATQARDVNRIHHAGVDVRQQRRFRQHEGAHFGEVRQRGVVSQRVERAPGGGIARLRLVAEREQRLAAARPFASARDGEHRVSVKIGWPVVLGSFGERAVVADVATQFGKRDEYLARIGHDVAVAGIAQAGRGADQIVGGRREQQSAQPRLRPARRLARRLAQRRKVACIRHPRTPLPRRRGAAEFPGQAAAGQPAAARPFVAVRPGRAPARGRR